MTCFVPAHSEEPIETVPPLPAGRSVPGAKTLADLTTIGVGGPITTLVEAEKEADLIEAVRAADDEGKPLLVIGGGSNVLARDDAFEGVVVRDMRSDIRLIQEGGCEGANLRVLGGTGWDELVVHTIQNEWMGLEALSGIPGTVGAAPIQNIGAYGQEIASSVARVQTWDRKTQSRREFTMNELGFGYRTSILKQTFSDGWGPSPRYIVLHVDLQLRIASLSAPVRFGQLSKILGVEGGTRVPATDVRAAVLELRRSKGMVLDDTDRDSYSCGSFFTNPVLTEEQAAALPDDAPRYPVTDESRLVLGAAAPTIEGQVKTSAAWLIDHAGFPAGYAMPGPAALSTKHCLALTNRGGASGEGLRNLACTVRDGVRERFGVELHPEPTVVGGL